MVSVFCRTIGKVNLKVAAAKSKQKDNRRPCNYNHRQHGELENDFKVNR